MTDWQAKIADAREILALAAEHYDVETEVDRIVTAAMLQEREFFRSFLEEIIVPAGVDGAGWMREQLLGMLDQLDQASAPEVARLFHEPKP